METSIEIKYKIIILSIIENMRYEDISKIVNVNKKTCGKILKEYKKEKISNEKFIISMYKDEYLSIKEISDKINYTEKNIIKFLKLHNSYERKDKFLKLTPKEMWDDYVECHYYISILSKKYKTTPKRVRNQFLKIGLKLVGPADIRRNTNEDEIPEDFINKYKESYSVKETSYFYNVQFSTISKWLSELHIKPNEEKTNNILNIIKEIKS